MGAGLTVLRLRILLSATNPEEGNQDPMQFE
jgi:hypothetical protein